MSRGFLWGVAAGAIGTYVFHKYVKPISGKSSG